MLIPNIMNWKINKTPINLFTNGFKSNGFCTLIDHPHMIPMKKLIVQNSIID